MNRYPPWMLDRTGRVFCWGRRPSAIKLCLTETKKPRRWDQGFGEFSGPGAGQNLMSSTGADMASSSSFIFRSPPTSLMRPRSSLRRSKPPIDDGLRDAVSFGRAVAVTGVRAGSLSSLSACVCLTRHGTRGAELARASEVVAAMAVERHWGWRPCRPRCRGLGRRRSFVPRP